MSHSRSNKPQDFSLKGEAQPHKTQYEAVLYYLSHLDATKVGAILDNRNTYQGFPKHVFILKLKEVLKIFKKAGDKVLRLHEGRCIGCRRGCRGFTFLGESGCFINVLFLTNRVKVEDIRECSSFVTSRKVPGKIRRLFIDVGEKDNLPF